MQFTYNYDFDKNGVIYFLGTLGNKKTNFENPHLLGVIRAFSSSLKSGKVEDFVGRSD